MIMASVSLKNNESKASLQASKSVEDHKKVQKLSGSNPFDALCDEDSGDDAITKAVAQLKQTIVSKPDNSKKANSSTNRYSNRYQNGWYRNNGAKSSSRSSNGTDDGASDKAEREQREEEFQKKLKEFKYNPEEEEKWRKFLAKSSELIAEKEALVKKLESLQQEQKNPSDADTASAELVRRAKLDKAVEDRNKVLEDKSKALEYIRLSNNKKMTLDEFEKMKEEQRKALQAPKGERRVVKSSDFDNMVVVVRKNFEEDSLSIMPEHKPEAKARMEAEKTEVQKGKKKKKTLLLNFGGSQSQGFNFSQQQEMYRRRGVPRRQVQSVKQNDAVPSLSSNLSDNFPALRSASGV